GADLLHELINGGSLMCTGGSQKCIDGPHSVKYSLHHRALKFAKRNGKFSLCFLLRAKIKNAKRRGRKISPSLTTTI
ncbi:MAG: hypothetical protein KHY31_17915, partial [Clostridiales bacterium]|nr:hypothetical protein [Clostridiales bacterium]